MPKKNAKVQKTNELDGREFFAAIDLIEKEKGIPKAYMLDKITQALVSAYKRDHEGAGDNVSVEADEAAGTDGDPHKDDIEYDEFNKLGTPASLGCIRLMVCDVKWIYDNCDIGTRVIIYDDAEDPGPMGKPGTIYTDPADETLRGWDPTDPDPANPWDDRYLSGTTIRSEAAWQEWNDAMADGRWNVTLTPTDLQGWSTDSSIEGTRG